MTSYDTLDRDIGAHTPGPWKVNEVRGGNKPRAYVWTDREWPKGVCVAEVYPGEIIGDHESNARLIAAAPAMLAALREAFDELCSENKNQELIDTVDAAIAAAEGRAQ